MALFDLDGNLILTKSKKNFSKSEISRFISRFGSPVIIASDMFPTSRTIERIVSTFSARLIMPKQSLSRKEKTRTVNSLRWRELKKLCGNRHEKDALVAAIFAFSRIERLMKRIDKRIKKYNLNQDLQTKIKTNVLLSGESITESIKRFTKT